jgi:hypothetical protein
VLVDELCRSAATFEATWRNYHVRNYGRGAKHAGDDKVGNSPRIIQPSPATPEDLARAQRLVKGKA